MDLLWIILLIIVIAIGIRNLINTKKVPNDTLQNSRYYRLLIVVIAGIFCVIVFLVKKVFY